jgi:hypothetical protein
MDAEWRHQLRVYLLDELADVARTDPERRRSDRSQTS